MTEYHYSLQRLRQKKHRCPACSQKTFVLYVSNSTNEYLDTNVGKCDREHKCGHHATPKAFFSANPDRCTPVQYFKPIPQPVRPVEYFPMDLVEGSMRQPQNNFIAYLVTLFGKEVAEDLRLKYLLGTSNQKWNGACVFWQVDNENRVRYGKVMQYDPETGRRVKDPYNHITGVHYLIGREEMNYSQTFFGSHLLSEYPDMKVALVEAEKTAVVCNVFMPNYLWLATGGKSGMKIENPAAVKMLENRKIYLFPDLGCYDSWYEKAKKIKSLINCTITVSDFLEKIATDEQKKEGLDLADFLTNRDSSGWAVTDTGYPAMWDYKIQYP
jgi:hypothetical protein